MVWWLPAAARAGEGEVAVHKSNLVHDNSHVSLEGTS